MNSPYDSIMARFRVRQLRGGPLSEDLVRSVENQLGYRLPEQYRDFLIKYNLYLIRGGAWFPDPERPGKPGGKVEFFFGINPQDPDDSYNLLNVRGNLREGLLQRGQWVEADAAMLELAKRMSRPRIPDNILPIAQASGCKICISLDGPNIGKIYISDPDSQEENPYKNLSLIADDFYSFMNSLYKEEQ